MSNHHPWATLWDVLGPRAMQIPHAEKTQKRENGGTFAGKGGAAGGDTFAGRGKAAGHAWASIAWHGMAWHGMHACQACTACTSMSKSVEQVVFFGLTKSKTEALPLIRTRPIRISITKGLKCHKWDLPKNTIVSRVEWNGMEQSRTQY